MANLKIDWTLPTQRESGKPLPVGEIKHVLIEISADGVNFGPVGTFPPTVLTTEVQDVDVGEWTVKGRAVDLKDRASQPVTASLVIADETPPGALPTLTLTLI